MNVRPEIKEQMYEEMIVKEFGYELLDMIRQLPNEATCKHSLN